VAEWRAYSGINTAFRQRDAATTLLTASSDSYEAALESLLIGIATFLAVQYVLAIDKETNGVRRGLHTRLSLVRDCLEVISDGRIPDPVLRRRVKQYSMIGTGRLRHTLLGLHYSRRVHDEQAAAIALIGNMMDFTRDLVDAPSRPVPSQRERLRELVNAIDQLREDLLAGRVPGLRSLPAPPPGELRRSPVYRLEYSVAILTEIYSSHLISQRVPEEKQKPKGLLRPDAFADPEILRFALVSRWQLFAAMCFTGQSTGRGSLPHSRPVL
jgi:multidrug resistance protein MdtO